MKKETKLYIGSTEVELSQNLDILYNYAIDDVTDPTAIKNGFSKTLTIMGTPNNNKVFGHYWNVERVIGNAGQNAGVDFNASKKAPFQIFINNEVYESGYVKLDKVNVNGEEISYECSLYGDLGNYFLNLSVNDNTGEKLKLSDMDYWEGGSDEFDFTVTASTVKLAWDKLQEGEEGKWSHINFMPAYNGYPADFDADKVVMNLKGTSLKQMDTSGMFKAKDGVTLGTLPQKMTEWEMRDLRSYLQRPVFRMKSIIQACCDPDQNGGYEVDLDPDFFSSGNPYYEKTWVTLPMMKNLEYANEEQILVGSTLVGITTTGQTSDMMYQDLKFSIGDYSNSTPSSIMVSAKIFCNNVFEDFNAEVLPELGGLSDVSTPNTSYIWFWNKKGDSYHSGWNCLGSLFVQMIALNGEVVVGASQAYNLTTPIRHNGKLYYGHNGHYSTENQFVPYLNKEIQNVLGTFQTDGFHREGSSEANALYFIIDKLNSPVSQLKMVYWWGATDNKLKHYQYSTLFDKTEDSGWIDLTPGPDAGYSPKSFALTVGVTYTNFNAILGASLGRTGTRVTKAMLLNTEASPCDYLLSYCKMFGLYFRKDVNTNRIQILSRKSYYQRDNIVNLNDYIDKGKEVKITPVAFSSKWYEFSQEMDDTEWQKKYLEGKGVQYGIRILNTGYEFNTEKKKLFDNNVLRSGIEGLERSKFYAAYNNDTVLRTWMGMGLNYNLYLGPTAATINVPITVDNTVLPLNEDEGMKYYDVFPKLQFHSKDNEPTDGNNVLVFFSGFKNVTTGRTNPLAYFLSDDNMYQTLYNEGTPCWLYTPTEQVGNEFLAIKVDDIPVFERYLTNDGSGKVDKSLDFGTPQEIFIPSYSLTEDACIYSYFWQRHMEDLCDPDTKMLDCYVRVRTKVNDEWLRRFYWFDNAIWRLNKITDWNVGGEDTTKMEFIKVQDVANYTSMTQANAPKIRFTASTYRVGKNGGVVTLYVDTDNPLLDWKIIFTEGAAVSPLSGSGDGTITVTFPSNNGDEFKYWYFTADAGVASARLTILQDYADSTSFKVNPPAILSPSVGGDYDVDFTWINQGNNYVTGSTTGSGQAVRTIVDTNTNQLENMGKVTVLPYTGASSTSGYVQFYSESSLTGTLGIDQLPSGYTFDPSGGSVDMRIEYSSGCTFTNLPSWATITESGKVYTIKARRNLYEEENDVVVTMTNPYGSSADFRLMQGSATTEVTESVTPTNLYFDATGGTQNITIKTSDSWVAVASPEGFCQLNQTQGPASSVISATVGENDTYSAKSGTITVTTSAGAEYVVYITQVASAITRSLSVTPTEASVPTSGGDVVVNITFEGNGFGQYSFINTQQGGAILSDITWAGEQGTQTITIPSNEETFASEYTVTWQVPEFNLSAQTVITQSYPSGVTPRNMYASFPASASMSTSDIEILGFYSSVPWTATTNSSWIGFQYNEGMTSGGSASIMIYPYTTNSGNTRQGTILIKARSGSQETLATIYVSQDGGNYEYLSVQPSSISFGKTGGTASFHISSNTNWTIS